MIAGYTGVINSSIFRFWSLYPKKVKYRAEEFRLFLAKANSFSFHWL